eukprot:TRINITY_DN8901_c0_g1_i2.p1 TRINITY_DN8901_c0_g1~~TRINITY_DN8901_c0_g1_i2.p1  ORF type:complete len:346 (-),score=27.29 TRINITY_DN8901_c0_g1_i2:76-1113(-)
MTCDRLLRRDIRSWALGLCAVLLIMGGTLVDRPTTHLTFPEFFTGQGSFSSTAFVAHKPTTAASTSSMGLTMQPWCQRFPACSKPDILQVDLYQDYFQFVLNLVKGPAFVSVRWSDGEWLCGTGLTSDSNGGSLRKLCPSAILRHLTSRRAANLHYFINCKWICTNGGIRQAMERLLARSVGKMPTFVPFVYSDALDSNPTVFREFVKEVRGRCVLVGPAHFGSLRKEFLQCVYHVSISYRNRLTSEALPNLYKKLVKGIAKLPAGRGFIFVAAGIASKIIVKDLEEGTVVKQVAANHTVMDIGTMFDRFVGFNKVGQKDTNRSQRVCKLYPEFALPSVCANRTS